MALTDFSMLGIYGTSLVLGAAHALEPGHGKTVVAAYLVGSRGRNLDAILLGLVVTFTHSFSIILLGLAAKYFAHDFTDQQLHGYLGIFASLTILILGCWLIKTRWKALNGQAGAHGHFHLFGGHHHHGPLSHEEQAHDHGHEHAHEHARSDVHGHRHERAHEHEHAHQHEDEHEHVAADGTVTRHSHADKPARPRVRETERLGLIGLTLLGISGGIVPCPAALALLLASLSVGDLSKGLMLVLIFSFGLALALVAIGLLVVNSVRASSRFLDTEKYAPKIAFASAALVTLVGAYTFYSSLTHFTSL